MITGRRILFVEDDAELRHLTKSTLEMLGRHQVLACESGIRAIASAGAFQPDLMLLDVSMPGLDGIQTLQALRRQSGLAAVPAVFLTTRTQANDISQYQGLGAIDVIAKPFDPQHLFDRITAVLSASGQADDAASAVPQRRSVLVVEDDPGIRFLIGFLLEQHGLQMRAAVDGRAGLALLQSEAPADLAILDIMMPGIDGLTLLDHMKQLPAWRDVPVMMMTTKNDEASIARAMAAGANDYVVKPFEPAELLQRLTRLLADSTSAAGSAPQL